jgi:hypothetical protein
MRTVDRSGNLLLSLFCAGVLLAFVFLVVFAALIPVLPCPEGGEVSEELNPCPHCNSHGRATWFQRWNYLRFAQDRESWYIYL